MNAQIDLAAYFERIGYDGPTGPSLECLQRLHLCHAQSISFENLNPLLKLPVALDPASLQEKLVRGVRGGYCFEQNLLFSHVLAALGFSVRGLLARVLWMVPEELVMPRTHMVLLVDIEGRSYIADVGFGGMTLTAPLRLEREVAQQTPHEPFRLWERGDEWTLQARVKDEWKSLYRFDLTPQHQIDFEVSNWYTSAHPSSLFVSNLLVARPAPGRRFGLRNNEFTIHYVDGTMERRTVGTGVHLQELLRSTFGLKVPEHPELQSVLDRVAAGPSLKVTSHER